MIWLRTAVFTLIVPGTVLLLIPSILLTSQIGPRLDLGMGHLTGIVLLVPGLAAILWCFIDFVRRGKGTPAPYDPPRQLVVAGLYRYVRNPQYVGVLFVILGEALLTGAVVLLGYAAVLAIMYHLFVRYYEEPTLKRLFGEPYVRYCQSVPRWFPRRSRIAKLCA